jgi:hypothetical protein
MTISVFEPLYTDPGSYRSLRNNKGRLIRHQFQRQPRWEDRDATSISPSATSPIAEKGHGAAAPLPTLKLPRHRHRGDQWWHVKQRLIRCGRGRVGVYELA